MGPRLRWRSLSHAISMLGPEIAITMPTSATGIHCPRSTNLPKMPTSTALMLPSATPMAATVPTSMRLLVGRIGPGLAGAFADALASAGASAVATLPASVCSAACEPASLAAARFATCSSISRTNFLYGAKKACATLVGFSMSLVMVASQSRPWRS
ncbi:hypothetical protein D9M68_887740 [compost metagenome]